MDRNAEHGQSRLGKAELGRYAFETQMPSSLHEILEHEDGSNKISGVIPKLAQLLEHEDRIADVYLCTDTAVQVFKIPNEGSTFCGYRNIQMILSSLRSSISAPAIRSLNIIEIQNMIEEAWAAGHNVHGRVQTDGIRNSRKHIGTFEAEALLSHLRIDCAVRGHYGKRAQEELLDFVAEYFSSSDSSPASTKSRVHRTQKAPIYLQRPGHSFTIIGIEENTDYKRRLLAFDPAWAAPSVMRAVNPLSDSLAASLLARKWILQQYRKPQRYLRRFDAFETISIG